MNLCLFQVPLSGWPPTGQYERRQRWAVGWFDTLLHINCKECESFHYFERSLDGWNLYLCMSSKISLSGWTPTVHFKNMTNIQMYRLEESMNGVWTYKPRATCCPSTIPRSLGKQYFRYRDLGIYIFLIFEGLLRFFVGDFLMFVP